MMDPEEYMEAYFEELDPSWKHEALHWWHDGTFSARSWTRDIPYYSLKGYTDRSKLLGVRDYAPINLKPEQTVRLMKIRNVYISETVPVATVSLGVDSVRYNFVQMLQACIRLIDLDVIRLSCRRHLFGVIDLEKRVIKLRHTTYEKLVFPPF